MAGRVADVFAKVRSLGYLGKRELADYAWFEREFAHALEGIDRRIASGSLVPARATGIDSIPEYGAPRARAGVFIGSFDPFQMSHLTVALRFLASDSCTADVVFIVPEGPREERKPRKTDYAFRRGILLLQLEGVFEPFLLAPDLGEEGGTIDIMKKLISLHPGGRLEITHVFGSDVLPVASSWLGKDLEAWGAEAAARGVEFSLKGYVVKRESRGPISHWLESMRSRGVELTLDRRMICTPSSTRFRDERALTLVFPTGAMLSRIEILLRYGMNRPWSGTGRESDPASRWEI